MPEVALFDGGADCISSTLAIISTHESQMYSEYLFPMLSLIVTWKLTSWPPPTYRSPGAAVANPGAITVMLIFSWYCVGFDAIQFT